MAWEDDSTAELLASAGMADGGGERSRSGGAGGRVRGRGLGGGADARPDAAGSPDWPTLQQAAAIGAAGPWLAGGGQLAGAPTAGGGGGGGRGASAAAAPEEERLQELRREALLYAASEHIRAGGSASRCALQAPDLTAKSFAMKQDAFSPGPRGDSCWCSCILPDRRMEAGRRSPELPEWCTQPASACYASCRLLVLPISSRVWIIRNCLHRFRGSAGPLNAV